MIRVDHRILDTATRIRAEADRLAIDVHALADRTGLGLGEVERIISGSHAPRLTDLYRIADALGIEVPDLIGTSTESHTGRVAS